MALLTLSAVIWLPVVGVLAVWVKLSSPGPVFFRQKRAGRNHTHFMIFKFRTMRTDTPHDVPTHLLGNPEQYVTTAGKFLRKTSLDELPQLFNIFVGDMSFVGPRPALWNQFDLIEMRDANGATKCTPGLTGLAQIRGRDELPLEVKAAYDGEYALRFGLRQDVKIFLGTFIPVLRGKGVKGN